MSDEDEESYVLTPSQVEIHNIEAQSRQMSVGFRLMNDDEGIYDTTNRAFETDEADKYRGDNGELVGTPRGQVFPDLPVLEFLWGKPWDNLALNVVLALRPSQIRVHGVKDSVKCNAITDRVSVVLEEDGRTIHKIKLEAVCGAIGVNSGTDLLEKLQTRQVPTNPGKGVRCISNLKSVIKLDF